MIIRDLAPLIVGEDPLNIEKFGSSFRERLLGDGGGNVLCRNERLLILLFGISKRKYLGTCFYQLPGGKTNEKLRAHASQLQFGWGINADISDT